MHGQLSKTKLSQKTKNQGAGKKQSHLACAFCCPHPTYIYTYLMGIIKSAQQPLLLYIGNKGIASSLQ